MCGICGIHSSTLGDELRSTVERMNRALHHRGPDDSGSFVSAACSIAMRRLAIIDLTTGHQPILNEDETLVIVFNGEIYNYRELREQLEVSGQHQLKTKSDTEVILHLYEDYAEKTPGLLHGMFSFCIYDLRKDSLFIARDRFGEKPLFYALPAGDFAFSSELRSLLEYPAIERRLNFEALFYYLHAGSAPHPLTMFDGIHQLPPGHWLRWENGTCHVERYYQPSFQVNPVYDCEEAASEAVRERILQAVKSQMVSDVPLGAFLSGGIDSSTIVAAMQRQSSQPINTFTVRFEHAPYDESPIARHVAEHLGTNHHEIVISNAGFDSDDLWRIIRHVGQPFSDSSAIPTYHICKYVRDYVTVCLSGDGGDEMFAGYHYFQWLLQVDRVAAHVPQALINSGYHLSKNMTGMPSIRHSEMLRKIRRALQIARMSARHRLMGLGTIFEQDELRQLIVPHFTNRWQRHADYKRTDQILSADTSSRLREMMAYRIDFPLAEDMLVKVDRMSMASSLEVRAPMLSAEVADLSMQLPDHLLIKNGTTKYILRQAVRDWLPKVVFSHPKTGFSIPLHEFQNDEYRRLCHELILDQASTLSQLFDHHALRQFVTRGLEQKRDTAEASVYRTSHQLWTLLQLAAWFHEYNPSV